QHLRHELPPDAGTGLDAGLSVCVGIDGRQCDYAALVFPPPRLAALKNKPGLTGPVCFMPQMCQAIRAKARRAASIVASMIASSCRVDTKPASKAEGARYTPSSSIAW